MSVFTKLELNILYHDDISNKLPTYLPGCTNDLIKDRNEAKFCKSGRKITMLTFSEGRKRIDVP